jgi:hypothetical protein
MVSVVRFILYLITTGFDELRDVQTWFAFLGPVVPHPGDRERSELKQRPTQLNRGRHTAAPVPREHPR